MAGNGVDTLSDYFWGVARQLRHRSREAMAPWEVSPSQSRALNELIHHEALRLSDLAEHLRIAPRSVTEVVDGLEARGFVERRGDPHDRRATLVAPTAEGRRVAEAISAARTQQTENYFADLTDIDRAHLTRILRKLNR